jgi:hypothetical protein
MRMTTGKATTQEGGKMNEYDKLDLTKDEKIELADAIAGGAISRSCPKAKVDWFNIKLSSGKRCVGEYKWESGNGEFLRLRIYAG